MSCGTPYWTQDRSEVSAEDGLVGGYEGHEQYMNPVHVIGEKLTLKRKQFYAIWRAGGMEFPRLQHCREKGQREYSETMTLQRRHI